MNLNQGIKTRDKIQINRMLEILTITLISAFVARVDVTSAAKKADTPLFDNRNRRNGLYYDSNFELTTSVMFNIHGERDAGQFLSDVSNPPFQENRRSLTQTGFDNMKKIGE